MKVEKRDCFRRIVGLVEKDIVSSRDKRKMQRIDLRNGWQGKQEESHLGGYSRGFKEKKKKFNARRAEIRGEVFRLVSLM